jgi:hypothetical protein
MDLVTIFLVVACLVLILMIYKKSKHGSTQTPHATKSSVPTLTIPSVTVASTPFPQNTPTVTTPSVVSITTPSPTTTTTTSPAPTTTSPSPTTTSMSPAPVTLVLTPPPGSTYPSWFSGLSETILQALKKLFNDVFTGSVSKGAPPTIANIIANATVNIFSNQTVSGAFNTLSMERKGIVITAVATAAATNFSSQEKANQAALDAAKSQLGV